MPYAIRGILVLSQPERGDHVHTVIDSPVSQSRYKTAYQEWDVASFGFNLVREMCVDAFP